MEGVDETLSTAEDSRDWQKVTRRHSWRKVRGRPKARAQRQGWHKQKKGDIDGANAVLKDKLGDGNGTDKSRH